jgi:hypothetical protein
MDADGPDGVKNTNEEKDEDLDDGDGVDFASDWG